MREIVSSLGDSDPNGASIIARVVEPDGEKLLQIDIYEPAGRAKLGRRSYRIHLTNDAVREMMRVMESEA